MLQSLPAAVLAPFALALFATAPTSAQTFVKDIDATPPTDLGGSDPAGFAFFGGLTFFSAVGEGTGRELFVSDGTAQGTGLVIDLLEGYPSSSPVQLTAFGGWLYFLASGPSGYGAFRTDGTPEGTELFLLGADAVATHDGRLYFRDGDILNPTTLYVSDGTVLGTSVLYQGGTGSTGLLGGDGAWFYFTGAGDEIWRTDGTPAGNELVVDAKNLRAVSLGSGQLWFFDLMGQIGGTPAPKWELWKSDVATGVTEMVVDLGGLKPKLLTAGQGGCMFTGQFNSSVEPWYSDGTELGTYQLADLSSSNSGSAPTDFTPFGSDFLFSADADVIGRELFITDGTPGGTQSVTDLWPGLGDSNPSDLTLLGGEVFFRAQSSNGNSELWKSDGTGPGTFLVADLKSSGGSAPTGLTSDGAVLWFAANADVVGNELFVTDGNGTAMVADLVTNRVSDSSWVDFLVDLNGTAIFLADDGVHGEEMWASDGTPEGTRMLADINPGLGGITLFGEAIFEEWFWFIEVHGFGSSFSLWTTDGTPEGTFEFIPEVDAFQLGVSNGKLYFAGEEPIADREPWVLHSKFEAPQLLKELAPGDTYPHDFYPVGDLTVFVAETPNRGHELFVTDGTEAGTSFLADINPGPDGSFPGNFTTLNGEVFFIAMTGFSERIWSTDGTQAGTVPRLDPQLALGTGDPYALTAGPDMLYFVSSGSAYAFDPQTDAGIDLLLDDVDGFNWIYFVGNNVMFLDADEENLYGYTGTPGVFETLAQVSGYQLNIDVETAGDIAFVQQDNELLTTDGTLAGTQVVDQLAPFTMTVFGTSGTGLAPTKVGTDSRILVQGYDLAAGRELWVSDGTEPGTEPLLDIDAGLANSAPSQFFRAGDKVFFIADDGVHGRELHVVPMGLTGGYVAESFGTVCPMTTGETPLISSTGEARVGNAGFTVDYDGAPAGAPALLFYSPKQGVGTLGGGCALYFGVPYFLYPGAAITDLTGHGSQPVPVPGDAGLVGIGLYFQYLVADPGGLIFGAVAPTDGLQVVLGS